MCCRHDTIAEPGQSPVCPVCFWEADGSDDPSRPSDPNHGLTLVEGRANYAEFGACEERFRDMVREPNRLERRGSSK
jgi:hypothetical protein